jgi:hypothetical protein
VNEQRALMGRAHNIEGKKEAGARVSWAVPPRREREREREREEGVGARAGSWADWAEMLREGRL